MNILTISENYADRWNFAHEHLRDALAVGHNEVRYGPHYPLWDKPPKHISKVISDYMPEADVVLVHHSQYTRWWAEGISEIKLPKILFVIDYVPRNWITKTAWIEESQFDAVVFPEKFMVKAFLKKKSPSCNTQPFYLPFGVNTDVFYPAPHDKIYDALALFSLNKEAYPHREKILQQVLNLRGVNSFVRGFSSYSGKLESDSYVRVICQSKIGIHSSDSFGSLSLRHFEYPACGTVVLTDQSEEIEAVGFKDGVNCVFYSPIKPKDLQNKIKTLIHEDEMRLSIQAAAYDFVVGHHTLKHRADEFWNWFEGR